LSFCSNFQGGWATPHELVKTKPCALSFATFTQVKQGLLGKLTVYWQAYQQQLTGSKFIEGDGSSVLPPDSVFTACSASASPAAAAVARSSSSRQHAGDGLWPHVHTYLFRDTARQQPR
jgi:hypothetical protein